MEKGLDKANTFSNSSLLSPYFLSTIEAVLHLGAEFFIVFCAGTHRFLPVFIVGMDRGALVGFVGGVWAKFRRKVLSGSCIKSIYQLTWSGQLKLTLESGFLGRLWLCGGRPKRVGDHRADLGWDLGVDPGQDLGGHLGYDYVN